MIHHILDPSTSVQTGPDDTEYLRAAEFVRSKHVIVEGLDDTTAVVVHTGTAARLKLSRKLHQFLNAFDRPNTVETALGAHPDERVLEQVRFFLSKGFLLEGDALEAPTALRRTSAVSHKLFNCPPHVPGQARPDVSVLGVPYDLADSMATGSRTAPSAIRLRSLDFSYMRDFATGHPKGWFDVDRKARILAGVTFADHGDVFVDYGEAQATFFERVGAIVDEILESGSFPVILGGDPPVSWPVVERLQRRGQLSVVLLAARRGFDREAPTQIVNTACIADRLCRLKGVNRLVHVGCRGYSREEESGAGATDGVGIVSVSDYRRTGDEAILAALPEATPVYISLNMNVLDPPFAPGAGDPAPGGLDLVEMKSILRCVGSSRQVAGLDIVNISPDRDHNAVTGITACHLVLAGLGAALSRERGGV